MKHLKINSNRISLFTHIDQTQKLKIKKKLLILKRMKKLKKKTFTILSLTKMFRISKLQKNFTNLTNH